MSTCGTQRRKRRHDELSMRPRWLVIAACAAMFVAILITNGVTTSQIGVDADGAAPNGRDDAVPAVVKNGGPVIDTTSGRTASRVPPSKTVALTFDDGPDPQWTPQVLAVLAKYRVPATFFVVGARAARYPDLVRAIASSGSEIGLHTFTHPDLGEVSAVRIDREMATTELALAGATGRISYLVRPPYSSEASALDDAGYQVVQRLGQDGYVTALVDVDSGDWARPGVEGITAAVLPAASAGGIVLMHDAGGDRSETVAALDRIIPQMLGRGVTFTTVTRAVGLPAADVPASAAQGALGRVMLAAVATARIAIDALEICLIVGGTLVLLRLLLMSGAAIVHGRRCRAREWRRWQAPVSVVVPAFNERRTIAATVRSLAAADHPVEIVVVDDGSTDDTAAIVERLGLANVRVLRKPNGGKPSALNAGVAASRHDIVVMLDGDTIFEPSTVGNLVAPFVDPQVGAVAGNARVADRRSLIARWQNIEYVVGFNIDRRAQDVWQAVTTVPGAVGAFRRSALLQVGGVSDQTLAEDTDLTIAVGRAGWRVVYEPTALAWTDAPATFAQLWRQRYRWSYGVMQSFWKHRHAVVERGRSGHLGRVGLLLTGMFQIVLPLMAPTIDIYLIYGLLFLDPARTTLLWAIALSPSRRRACSRSD